MNGRYGALSEIRHDHRLGSVLVVGAGHNGLVAARYLARTGYDVEVVEANDWIGGCTTTAALIDGAPEHLRRRG